MSNKKISFGPKPLVKTDTIPDPNQWVENRDNNSEKVLMKRLTFDVPESLHRIIKMSCASRGTKIGQEIITLLEAHYCKNLEN